MLCRDRTQNPSIIHKHKCRTPMILSVVTQGAMMTTALSVVPSCGPTCAYEGPVQSERVVMECVEPVKMGRPGE